MNEIQDVYRLQGVKINDKHIEVIVRQMLQKIEISASGDTTLLPGEQIDRVEFDELNEKMEAAGASVRRKARRCCWASPRPRCRRAAFVSAASFQETTRVLTEASVHGQAGQAGRA